jgi:hypothetical protein
LLKFLETKDKRFKDSNDSLRESKEKIGKYLGSDAQTPWKISKCSFFTLYFNYGLSISKHLTETGSVNAKFCMKV